eukprot:562232-Rhodomonas_salina.1
MLAVHRVGGSALMSVGESGELRERGPEHVCELITPGARCRGTLEIQQVAGLLHFKPHAVQTPAFTHHPESLRVFASRMHHAHLADVLQIHAPHFLMLQTALQIFFAHAPPLLFNFPDPDPESGTVFNSSRRWSLPKMLGREQGT